MFNIHFKTQHDFLLIYLQFINKMFYHYKVYQLIDYINQYYYNLIAKLQVLHYIYFIN